MRRPAWILGAIVGLGLIARVRADSADWDDPEASAERGRIALTSTGYLPPGWGDAAYRDARAFLGDDAPDPDLDPEGYAAAFRRHYGLHPAPYPNDGLPMGLRRGNGPDGTEVGLQIDCMVCHGGSIGGTSYVGLGNTTLDLHPLLTDLTLADGRLPMSWGFSLNTTRGVNNAGQVSALLLGFRNTDLSRRIFPRDLGARFPDMDVPAWWLIGKKATMYYDGRTDARSARSVMQFFLGDLTLDQFRDLEPTFKDILAYLKTIKAPPYPFSIDRARADRGRTIFESTCSKCHGTYGLEGTYPSRIIDLATIGTDPARALGMADSFVAHYNATWFAEEYPVNPEMVGYQAPPLDGIWATAPYLHNGSVPTLAELLNSTTRPARFRRANSTDFAHYDTVKVGWKYEPISEPPSPSLPSAEVRAIYDTSRFGLDNDGHTFGDKLSGEERQDVIEYLKTL